MKRLKKLGVVLVAAFALGVVGAQSASAATGNIGTGGTSCNFNTNSSVVPPTTINSAGITVSGCSVFGTSATITGNMDVTAPAAGTIRIDPTGAKVDFAVKLFGATLCTVTVTDPNYVDLTGGPPTYSATVPVTSPASGTAMATDAGGSCPAKPYNVSMSMTLP